LRPQRQRARQHGRTSVDLRATLVIDRLERGGDRQARSTAAGGRGIVLVALTGYGSERDANRSADAGFDQHLTKPVDLNELMKVLDECQATGYLF
jgi:CheY-like chemotaxis protein